MGEMTNMTDMTNMPGGQGQCTVQDVMAVMEEAYPPDFAEQWDHPGLVCGDPTAVVKHLLRGGPYAGYFGCSIGRTCTDGYHSPSGPFRLCPFRGC